MGDALSMALQKVMGLSDEAIRRKVKKTPNGAKDGEGIPGAGADEESHEGVAKMAQDMAHGEGEPETDGLSDADKERLRQLYEKLSAGE